MMDKSIIIESRKTETNISENKLLILFNSSILVTISPVVLLLILYKGIENRCLKNSGNIYTSTKLLK
jgi:formate hydrogenlyase subunit 4